MRRRCCVALLLTCSLLIAACGGDGGSDATSTQTAAADRSVKPDTIEVPDVVGKTFGAAKRTLAHAGLQLTTQGFPGTLANRAYDGRCTVVTSAAPRAGTRVAEASKVSIVYGICRKEIVSRGGEG
jgi:hypothetical protein